MAVEKKEIYQCKCKKCWYEWETGEEPEQCTRCKSTEIEKSVRY